MGGSPKVGDRKPCRGDSPDYKCEKTATFIETVTVHRQAIPTETGTQLVPESGPGWLCPDGHREIYRQASQDR